MAGASDNGQRRVVITGVGMVTPLGNDPDVDLEELARRRVGSRADHALRHDRLRRALRLRAQGLRARRDWMDRKKARRMDASRSSRCRRRGWRRQTAGSRSPLRRSAWAPQWRPASAGSTPSRTASRTCSSAARTGRARSRSSRSSRTWLPPGSRWSSARRGHSRPSAPRARRRTWRSATGSMRSASDAPT